MIDKDRRHPEWLNKKIHVSRQHRMKAMLSDLKLSTICEEAMCPNITECFEKKQATFLILGTACTRQCSFCNVEKTRPFPIDREEPARVAEAVQRLGLRHVVITSPTRDDLTDGGAAHFADVVYTIKDINPHTRVELLIPDFQGKDIDLAIVQKSRPDILGHNLETVPRLYHIRRGADYQRSLQVLENARRIKPDIPTKSGLMLGLGEQKEEVLQVMRDLISVDCRLLSLGQYLAPSRDHHPVFEYIPPHLFDEYRESALAMGFDYVESGPYVRSSFHAEDYIISSDIIRS